MHDEYMFKIEYKKYLYNNFNINNLTKYTNYSSNPELLNTLSTKETQLSFFNNNFNFDRNI